MGEGLDALAVLPDVQSVGEVGEGFLGVHITARVTCYVPSLLTEDDPGVRLAQAVQCLRTVSQCGQRLG